LETSCESDTESIQEVCECAFKNLKKAQVIIDGIVLDGDLFWRSSDVLIIITHMNNKIHRSKILPKFTDTGIAWFLTPSLEDYYEGLSINIEACGGDFHEDVARLHLCLACLYESYAAHSHLRKL
jgi:hypothetical protein